MKEPFELHTPSVFAISSPLQVLCAVAAIRQLEINDFRVAVCYAKGDARNEQLWSILDYFKMYDRVLMPISKFNLFLYRLKSMIHRNSINAFLLVISEVHMILFWEVAMFQMDRILFT